MRAHYLQHVPFEGLGSIESWLQTNGYEITCTKFFESSTLPALSDFDFLVVMGGPMSVNDEHKYQWLTLEKKFIRNTIESGKPIVGICLGAQLIACAMGAKVYPSQEKEIGWFPVYGILPTDNSCFNFSASMDAFHWHGETFDLPSGAIQIARSDGCANQAFQIGQSVIGLQFHLETTPESAQLLISNCRDELTPSRYVQTEDEILSVQQECYHRINKEMKNILSYLHQG